MTICKETKHESENYAKKMEPPQDICEMIE